MMHPFLAIATLVALLLAPGALTQEVMFSDVGYGTYYYDVFDKDACLADPGMDKNPVECSHEIYLSLEEINSDYLVAMNHTQLASDLGRWCGKRVIVSVNGKPSDMPFFIGDGCGRCSRDLTEGDEWNSAGAPGLDFSFAALNKFNSEACEKGHIDISWDIVDEQIYDFATDGTSMTNGWATSPPLTKPIPSPTTTTAPTSTSSSGTVPH